MSGSLTDAAPDIQDPDVSVETPEGSEDVEVEVGSISDQEQVVPVSRFNGLMSSFNKTQAERDQYLAALSQKDQELATLRAQLETTPTQEQYDVSEIEDLKSQVSQLTSLILKRENESAKKTVFEEYPEAKAFEDIIVANDPDEYREMARTIAERVRSNFSNQPQSAAPAPVAQEQAPASAPSAPPATPFVPVSQPTADVEELRTRASETGSLDDVLAFVRARESNSPDGTVLA